jgi:exodeoxyribonuclease V alpha subunit
LEGQVEEIVFQNTDNGYTVCMVDGGDEPITVVGILPMLAEGEYIRALGNWVKHPTYGKQFKCVYFEKQLPADTNSMLKYLAAGTIRGVGEKTAARLVAHFGVDTFDVIENDPDMLTEVKGISPKKARQISQSFREQFGMRDVMLFFQPYFSPALSGRIYKKFGAAAVDIVQKNPYILSDEVHGIGFEKADRLANGIGIASDDPHRIQAGILYVLRFNADTNGHVYLPLQKLTDASAALLKVTPEQAAEGIQCLARDMKVVLVSMSDHTAVYASSFFYAERTAAAKLVTLSRIRLSYEDMQADTLLRQVETQRGLTYVEEQKQAIFSTLQHAVTILTGGPGTGKTTIIRAAVSLFANLGLSYALAAPTGRAAKRMSESTGEEAKTIHRLLEMNYSEQEEMQFVRNEHYLLTQDVIIIDEASMMDIFLFSSLLKAIKPGARVMLIGDSDQLPSVGAGNVLSDLIASKVFPVICLKKIFRQSRESQIVLNAHRINEGQYPNLNQKIGDFFFLSRESPAQAAETVISLCKDRLPARYGEDIVSQIQVITPTRKGDAGTKQLNLLLQAALNPPSKHKGERKNKDIIFRVGDKVMQIRNNYDIVWTNTNDEHAPGGIGVFNGDIGTILNMDFKDEILQIDFDGRLICYRFESIEDLEHAYAITVHKSQGSEYPVVILPLSGDFPFLTTRNLLYTAITRAQKMVILVGKRQAVFNMVDNNRHHFRYSGLHILLQQEVT